MRKYISYPMAAMLAVTATLGAVKTSTAASFPVDTVTSTTAVPQNVIEARWHGGAFAAGAALGLLGAAIASPYYYGPYYSYDYPSYAYAPYYGYWGHRHHRHFRHYGY